MTAVVNVVQDIMDERYAAVDVLGKGLVLFSSCSHAGICNVVTDAIERFQRPVYMVSSFSTTDSFSLML